MDIQLIAMDLDGTALLDDHRSFSPPAHSRPSWKRTAGALP